MELRFFSVGSPNFLSAQLRTTVHFIMSPVQLIEILIGLTNRGRWQAGGTQINSQITQAIKLTTANVATIPR